MEPPNKLRLGGYGIRHNRLTTDSRLPDATDQILRWKPFQRAGQVLSLKDFPAFAESTSVLAIGQQSSNAKRSKCCRQRAWKSLRELLDKSNRRLGTIN
jgi:hypothetical protein